MRFKAGVWLGVSLGFAGLVAAWFISRYRHETYFYPPEILSSKYVAIEHPNGSSSDGDARGGAKDAPGAMVSIRE